ncbi:hypothetical protein [Pseudobacteriovorax antillogorgiicola]|nr:hypothetical protein [Pseudobacteriovorax antillogorgiicola]
MKLFNCALVMGLGIAGIGSYANADTCSRYEGTTGTYVDFNDAAFNSAYRSLWVNVQADEPTALAGDASLLNDIKAFVADEDRFGDLKLVLAKADKSADGVLNHFSGKVADSILDCSVAYKLTYAIQADLNLRFAADGYYPSLSLEGSDALESFFNSNDREQAIQAKLENALNNGSLRAMVSNAGGDYGLYYWAQTNLLLVDNAGHVVVISYETGD